MEIGEIEYTQGGFFRREYWSVCYHKSKHSSTSAIFYKYELARIYAELIKIKAKLK